MKLHDYLLSPGAMTSAELCKAAKIKNPDQLRQWRHGYAGRQPDAANCVSIERATKGAVTRADLRPDDYWLIWPDLKAPKRAKQAA
jgi:DNA-binding transcriptional regulator YdaS (Cro superfamily)